MSVAPGQRSQRFRRGWSRFVFRLRVAAEYARLFARYSSRYVRLTRLDRPIGIWLLLWPTLWALWVATAGRPSAGLFAVFVGGTILTRSAGCIINDFADRKLDRLVARTAGRPLATGEVDPFEALLLFAGLMLIAFGLVLTQNRLTVYLALIGAGLTLVYPFMKRLIAAPQFVLGLAFAWGVPMAFAAATAELSRTAWLIYLVAIVWVIIYDTEYAMADRPDDVQAGIRSTAILFGEMDRVVLASLQLTMLAGLVFLGRNLEMGVAYYSALAVASLLGLRQQYLIRDREPALCIAAFQNNAWLGGAVFAGIALDYTFRLPLPGG